MQKTDFIWFNGKLVAWDDAKVHVMTHALHYGGNAFEGIRFYKTDRGPAIFKLNAHVDRLLHSAQALKMPVAYTRDEIFNAIIEVVRVNQLEAGYIRPMIFFGYGKIGVNPVGCHTDMAISCFPWGVYLPHESVDLKISQYIRIHPKSTDVTAKLSGHYVNGMLASLELAGTHYHEALLLDSEGFISEGVAENFFMVKDGVIYTPHLGTILPGITREVVMELAKKWGYSVIEKQITPAEAFDADEAFFTGTAAEVTPIRTIEDHRLGLQDVGPITAKIKTAYADIVRGVNPDYTHHLHYVSP